MQDVGGVFYFRDIQVKAHFAPAIFFGGKMSSYFWSHRADSKV